MEQIDNRMVVDSEWPECHPVLICELKGCGICEDMDYYDINGDIVCEDCLKDYMKKFRRVAHG